LSPALDEDGTPLAKLQIDFVYAGEPRVETVWALPAGGKTYEIRNCPWYAYGINWGDVVRCAEGELPVVKAVVERSGHRTLRVFFDQALTRKAQDEILARLNEAGATFERGTARLVAIDVEPDVDYDAVYSLLAGLERDGLLQFEEAWVASSTTDFGDADRG
jgi:hypothetical protein